MNNKPIMPEATPTERANALIDWAERDGQRMGNEERRLIVEYAETVGDTDKVIELINRLCEQGYEMQHGHMDDFVRSQIESEIAVAKAEQQTALDPAAEPVVTILSPKAPIWKWASKCRCMRLTPCLPGWTQNIEAAATMTRPTSALILHSKESRTAIPGGRILATGTVP